MQSKLYLVIGSQSKEPVSQSQYWLVYGEYSILDVGSWVIIANAINDNVSLIAHEYEQGKSEGFHSCDRPSNFIQIGFKSSIFQPVWHWNLMDTLEE